MARLTDERLAALREDANWYRDHGASGLRIGLADLDALIAEVDALRASIKKLHHDFPIIVASQIYEVTPVYDTPDFGASTKDLEA